MANRAFDVSQLALWPAEAQLDYLVERPEDQWLERKSARIRAQDLGDLLVGFANAEGGLIVLGIEGGQVSGLPVERENHFRQAAIDFTRPPVRHRFSLVECASAGGANVNLGIIEVEPSDHVHANVRGDTYLRVGDENRKLSAVQAQELRYDKGESAFDGSLANGAGLQDLDARLVQAYAKRTHARASTQKLLLARGLAARNRDQDVIPTVAGLLVLGSSPQLLFPQAQIRLLRYRGSSRETGSRANVIADRRIEGSITAQIVSARRVLRRWLPPAIRLQEEGRFGPSTLIPQFVWLESIVNALTHRSYSIGGDHIRVELFDDRLEVESPGRLPGLVRLDNIRSTRFARNPRIARALADLGYGRELGEGVNRMFEEMNRAGLPDPVFEQGAASLRVILLADPVAARVLDRLPPGSERFVEFVSRLGRVTTKEAADLLAVSRPTARKYLYDLVEVGLLEHVGTSSNDPRGYWRLLRAGASRR